MRISLHPGVWIGTAGLEIMGGIAMTQSGLPAQVATYRLGEIAVFLGASLFVWGIKWKKEHWWHLAWRKVTGRDGPPSPASFGYDDHQDGRRVIPVIDRRLYDVEKGERIGFGDRTEAEIVRGSAPKTPIWKAAEYVRQVIGDDDLHNGYPETRHQIREAAHGNRLEIWGRLEIPPIHLTSPQSASTLWTPIETEYWKTHELIPVALDETADDLAHTWREADKIKIGDRYWSLRVHQEQVEDIWSADR